MLNPLSTFGSLLATYTDNWLLHGDLHHENILQGQGGAFKAIDPKGVYGPRIFECARYLHNFIGDEVDSEDDYRVQALLRTRAATLAETTGFPVRDILLAGFVDLVLACAWTLSSHTGLNQAGYLLMQQYLQLLEQ